MNEFSSKRGAEGYVAQCQQGNLFFIGNPTNQSCPALRGHVGGLSTPSIPQNLVEILQNDVPGTVQQVQLEVSGTPYTLRRSAEDFGQCTRPEQLEVRVGLAPPAAASAQAPWRFDREGLVQPTEADETRPQQRSMVPIGKVSSARMPGQFGNVERGHEMNALDVLAEMQQHEYAENRAMADTTLVTAVEVDAVLGPPPGGEGTKDVDALSDSEAIWLNETVQSYIKRIGGVAIRVGVILSVQEHRQFLREMGFTKVRFYTMSNGARMVAFAGNNRLRDMITGTTYSIKGMTGKNISVLNTGFRTPVQNAVGAAKNLGTKTGVIGIIFVAGVDIAAYYAQPAHERELSDLMVDLGLDLSIAVVSSIAGAVIAGAAIAATTVAAPVAVFVGAGILVGVAVGWAIGEAVSYFGLRERLKEAFRNTEAVPDDLYQGMMTAP